jgi:D-xylonolactonase
VSQPSSCAFGGKDHATLFITSAWQGMNTAEREAEPLAGSIFAMQTDTCGLPVNLFQLEKSER